MDCLDTKSNGSVINSHYLTSVKSCLLSSHSHQFFLYTVESLSVPSLSFPPHFESSYNGFLTSLISFSLSLYFVASLILLKPGSDKLTLLPERSFTEMVAIAYKINNWNSLANISKPIFPAFLLTISRDLIHAPGKIWITHEYSENPRQNRYHEIQSGISWVMQLRLGKT